MVNRYVLGLDVSTSVTGLCVINRDVELDGSGTHIVALERIEFKKCKTLWEKADRVQAELTAIKNVAGNVEWIVCVEEALLGFRPGLSSATTISALLRFNGIVSYIARNVFATEPQFIGSTHARKVCGMKMQRTAKAGMNQKEQVFLHMSQNDLKHVAWPKTKTGKVVPWSRDATDAYVVARAGCLMNT